MAAAAEEEQAGQRASSITARKGHLQEQRSSSVLSGPRPRWAAATAGHTSVCQTTCRYSLAVPCASLFHRRTWNWNREHKVREAVTSGTDHRGRGQCPSLQSQRAVMETGLVGVHGQAREPSRLPMAANSSLFSLWQIYFTKWKKWLVCSSVFATFSGPSVEWVPERKTSSIRHGERRKGSFTCRKKCQLGSQVTLL